jgi:hypothetical protein
MAATRGRKETSRPGHSSYMVFTFLLVNIKIAVIEKPTAHIARSIVLPKAWSAAPASTEAIGM